MMNSKAVFYLVLTIFLFGGATVMNKGGLNAGLEPYSFALCIVLVPGLFAIPYLLFRKAGVRSIKREDWKYIIAVGLLGSGIVHLLTTFGIKLSTATNAGFIWTLTAVTTSLFSYMFLGERFGRKRVLFAAIALSGVFLLTTRGEMIVPMLGDLLLLSGVLLIGASNMMSKLGMRNTKGDVVSSFRLLVGSVFLLAVTPLMVGANMFSALVEGPQWVLASGVLIFLFAASFFKGIEHSNPGVATIVVTGQSVVTAAFSFIFLGETMLPIQLLGAGLILTGICLVAVKT